MFERMPAADRPSVERDGREALLVIDPVAASLLYINDAAAELFGIEDDRPLAPGALLAELSDLSARDFATQFSREAATRSLAVRVETLQPGPFNTSEAVLVRIRDERAPDEAAAGAKRVERLEALWSLVVRRGFAGEEQVGALLREGLAGIGLDAAVLGRVDGRELIVERAVGAPLENGERLPLERTLARDALRRAGTFAVLDASAEREYGDLAFPARSFLASAFHVGEERWVITFSSEAAREAPFDVEDWHYVDFLVEALARAIERSESDARITKLAYSDTLTSLPNRAALMSRLDETVAEAERLGLRAAVLFLDLDGFKAVNDAIGHHGGDAVLAEVAARLRSTLRREEFIGRLGGDEFAIVMSHVASREQIESIAQRIGAVLTQPFTVGDQRFTLSASIGVAVYPDDAQTRGDLLAAADAAMYRAKEQGGARIRFGDGDWTTEASVGGMAPADLTSEPRDIGYLLAYQPIVDARDGRITGAEALIRRVHPLHGLLAPEHGWSISRDEDARRALDRWVLREAASQAHSWAAGGADLRVDVNLAAYDPREIETLFGDEGLSGDLARLRIEISAAQFAGGDTAEFVAFVERCVTSGMSFALDEFDAGLASLQSLAALPVRAIKLARGLTEHVAESRTAQALVQATVVVAKSLGWSVVAKGVETQAQQEALVSLGVDGVQGFHIAHPMTAIDFAAWLRDRQGRA